MLWLVRLGGLSVSIARSYATAVAALGCVVVLAAAPAPAATISLGTITNNSTCVTANGDDGNDSEQAYNVGNAACSEPLGGSDSNFFRVTSSGAASSSAAPGGSTAVGFAIDAAVGVDSAVDGQDEYERGKVRYTLGFTVNATAVENWTVGLSQNVLGLFGFKGDGAATAVGTQVFGNAGISVIDVDVGATDVSFSPAPAAASSNVANTSQQSFGPIGGSRNDAIVASGTGDGAFTVTIAFDIDAFSNAGCTGFICSSASGGEDAAVLLGYDNVDDCCGGTVDRINADNYSTWGRAVGPDGYDSTWTFSVTTECGNGVIDGIEQCDEGAANGLPTSCCTSLCTRRPSGATCRAPAGVCDMAELCSGASATCPADVFQPNTFYCRAASNGDSCDVSEQCTGSGPNCPADPVQPNGTTCRPGSGDLCDPTETCDGISKTCPTDTVSPPGTSCRAGSGDVCDLTETCTGVAGQPCPANDAPGKAGLVCRAGSGDMCDLNETCTGIPGPPARRTTRRARPAPSVAPARVTSCDVAETCTGTPGATCPANDAPGKASAVCRAGSGDPCDVNETCHRYAGRSPVRPDDAPGKAGTVCRAGSGDACDVSETCTGTPGATCPANDAPGKSSTVCRAGSGDACDVDETCTGTPGATCPANVVASSGTVCRAAAGACDVAETCSGTAGQSCPGNGFMPDGTGCPDGLFCNGAETCQSGVCTDNDNPCIVGLRRGTAGVPRHLSAGAALRLPHRRQVDPAAERQVAGRQGQVPVEVAQRPGLAANGLRPAADHHRLRVVSLRRRRRDRRHRRAVGPAALAALERQGLQLHRRLRRPGRHPEDPAQRHGHRRPLEGLLEGERRRPPGSDPGHAAARQRRLPRHRPDAQHGDQRLLGVGVRRE